MPGNTSKTWSKLTFVLFNDFTHYEDLHIGTVLKTFWGRSMDVLSVTIYYSNIVLSDSDKLNIAANVGLCKLF